MARSAFSPNNGRMVEGPLAGSSTDNAIVRWDSTTGRVLQNSGVTINDSDVVTAAGVAVTGTAANPMVDISQPSSAYIAMRVSGAVGAELTQALIRGTGYSPSFELLDKDSVQNWYFGIDDNDSDALNIGRGYGPGQGITPAIKIATTDVITLSNNLAFSNGKGIDFSATSDAAGMASELLDDYEEGTWTPAFTFETAGDLSVTYTNARAGYYTKVGNSVNLNYNCTLSTCTYTTASGFANVTGLPFTNHGAAGARTHGVCAPGLASGSIGTAFSTIEGVGTVFRMYFVNHAGGGLDALAVAHMPTGRAYNIEGAIHHRVS